MPLSSEPRLETDTRPWWLPLALLWAAPYTCCGLLVGGLALLTGGSAQYHGRTIEFSGGLATLFVRHICGHWVSAVTLGHTILGRDRACLDAVREHEWVHVRQYERWGLLFGPAYVASSLWAWIQGKNPYRDNIFEREAYGDDE